MKVLAGVCAHRVVLTTLLDIKDTCSANIAYTDEAIKEVDDFFDSTIAYIGTDGKFISNVETDTIKYLLHNLTG